MPLNTVIDVNLLATLTAALPADAGNLASAPVKANKRLTLATGTGNAQADKVFAGTRTVAASGTDALDLAGVLVDPFGAALTIVKLKAVLVRAAATNVNNVRVNRPATNGVPLFLAASDGIDILPGGVFLWAAPNTGVTVTPATGDLINFDNSGSGTSVTYDVVLVGTSA
jgi:hypothetical protein